jgi:hypothetical protein
MLETRTQGTRWAFRAVLSIPTGLLLASLAAAQAPGAGDTDFAGQVRRANEIAAQKLEADVREALRTATRLAASNAAQAVEQLKGALARVTDDTALAQGRRAALTRLLQERIRITQAEADRAAAKAESQQETTGRRADEARRRADHAKLARILSGIKVLVDEGKTGEAGRTIDDLAQRNPDNPAVQAARRTNTVADQLAHSQRLQNERDRGFMGVTRSVEQSALPPTHDMEFPKDWKERTKNRLTTVPLTAKERAILQALDSMVSVNFKEARLEAVIDFLQNHTRQPIVLDKLALQEADVTYESPVTVQLNNVTVRTVLRKILRDLGLTYVIKEQTIHVTTAVKARDMMVVRTYYIGDVITNPTFGNFGFGFPPGFNQLQALQNAQQITELIQNAIDPDSWQTRNGPGTIVFHPATMSLVVRQSAEVHALLGGGLLR